VAEKCQLPCGARLDSKNSNETSLNACEGLAGPITASNATTATERRNIFDNTRTPHPIFRSLQKPTFRSRRFRKQPADNRASDVPSDGAPRRNFIADRAARVVD
jgi:hypothetical protein